MLPKYDKEKKAKKFECSYCHKIFKFASQKERHEQSHSVKFHCKFCNKDFSFLSALKRHELQHERTGRVTCQECGGTFRDADLLKRHMKYAHKGNYTCSECLSKFKSEKALNTHLKIHKPKSEQPFKCSYAACDKRFNFYHHLKHHELTHTDSKQHYCGTCGKGFIQLHHLKNHLKSHEPEKWLCCTKTGCTKQFTTEYARKRHIATHKEKAEKKPTICKKLDIANSDALSTNNEASRLNGGSCTLGRKLVPSLKVNLQSETFIKSEEYVNTSPVNLTKEDVDTELTILENEAHTRDARREHLKYSDTDIDSEIFNSDCKTAFGKCIVTGEFEINENCICKQITENKGTHKNVFDDILITNDNSPYDNPVSSSKLANNNSSSSACNKCSYLKVDKKIECKPQCCNTSSDNNPKIKQSADGVIMLDETCDIDFTQINNIVKQSIIKESKTCTNNELVIPYNSCKAVLGNCIVSGNDTIGEGCLCVRMKIESQQVTSEEIEEISIYNSHFNC